MDKKKIIILGVVIGLVVSALGIGLYYILKGKPREIVDTTVDKYVAYVKINPSVKLSYSYKCNKFNDDTIECDDPIVDEYELVNDDAKEIFKEVNLLEGNKELSYVIDLICTRTKEKGIKTDTIEIQSDWNGIENYLTKKQEEKKKIEETSETNKEENTTTKEEDKKEETNTITFNNQTKETIDKAIVEDVNKEIAEKKAAEEKAKKAAEAKAKAEAAAKAKAAVTIKLSSGVTYCHSMMTYECNNCFSNTLINQLKSAKGHYVKSSSSSSITILRITKLSGSYNSTNYYGGSLLNKITAAGGQNVGGAGGCDDKLTSAICKQYHLTCA